MPAPVTVEQETVTFDNRDLRGPGSYVGDDTDRGYVGTSNNFSAAYLET